MRAQDIALIQAIYYGLTGLWPLFSMQTFLKVTGPKTDLWLVRCVGLLVSVTAVALLYAAFSPTVPTEIKILAAGDAAALGILEAYYVFRGRISPIYLLDTVLELGLIAAWLFVMQNGT